MKVIYFCDPIGSISSTPKQEGRIIESELLAIGIKTKVIVQTDPYFRTQPFDILFFDYGGMSLGNNMLHSFCRELIEHAREHPNSIYIMRALFTKEAMKEYQEELRRSFEEPPSNIYLTLELAIPFLKIIYVDNNKKGKR